MGGIALTLYAAFAVVAFGLRTAMQVRRTGDSGFRRPKGAFGSAEWLAGALFVVALLIGVAGPIADIAGWVEPLNALRSSVVQGLGIAVACLGILATFLAQLAMGSSWRIGVDPDERTELVTGGVFGIVRNPIFSAMLLTAFGLTLVVPNAISIAGFAALVLGLELQVRRVEEPYLLVAHGQPYADYLARVGRFVPGLGLKRA